jgi:hypothetical protein
MTKFKKPVVFALLVIMCVTLVPVNVFAAFGSNTYTFDLPPKSMPSISTFSPLASASTWIVLPPLSVYDHVECNFSGVRAEVTGLPGASFLSGVHLLWVTNDTCEYKYGVTVTVYYR